MTNFKKEELQEIKRCLKYMIEGGTTPYSSLTMAINKKIQQMIDNYCEHDAKWIARSHLNEASSLISHAICLLGLEWEIIDA